MLIWVGGGTLKGSQAEILPFKKFDDDCYCLCCEYGILQSKQSGWRLRTQKVMILDQDWRMLVFFPLKVRLGVEENRVKRLHLFSAYCPVHDGRGAG